MVAILQQGEEESLQELLPGGSAASSTSTPNVRRRLPVFCLLMVGVEAGTPRAEWYLAEVTLLSGILSDTVYITDSASFLLLLGADADQYMTLILLQASWMVNQPRARFDSGRCRWGSARWRAR